MVVNILTNIIRKWVGDLRVKVLIRLNLSVSFSRQLGAEVVGCLGIFLLSSLINITVLAVLG